MRDGQRAILLGALVALVLSCSVVNDPGRHMGGTTPERDGGPRDGGAPPLAAREACAAIAATYCDAYVSCCTTPTQTRDECLANVLDQCRTGIEPYFVDVRTGYDPVIAGELLVQGRAITAECDPQIAEWFLYDLLTVLQGTVPQSSPCITLAQALAGDYAGVLSCQRSMNQVCRPTGGPLGDWECQGVSAEGGPCNHLIHCQPGLFCTGTLLLNGMCDPQRGMGMPCELGEQCQSLNCGPTTRTCEPSDASVYCNDLFPRTMPMDMAL